jgi:hypothetical protein
VNNTYNKGFRERKSKKCKEIQHIKFLWILKEERIVMGIKSSGDPISTND